MKIFENKSIFKKLIIVLICIMLFSFCMPKAIIAAGNGDAEDGVGGKLLKPVVDLFLGIGDGILNMVHKMIFHQEESTITIDMTSKWWEIFSTVMVGIIAAVVVAAVVVFSAGAVVAAAAAIGVTLSTIGVGTVLVASVIGGVGAAAVYNSNVLPDDLQLPVYLISPEEIFSNKIVLFDVDFFNPSEDTERIVTRTPERVEAGAEITLDYTTEERNSKIYANCTLDGKHFNIDITEADNVNGPSENIVIGEWFKEQFRWKENF